MQVLSILVAYDGTEHSDRALERARMYSATFGARLVVVTATLPVVASASPVMVAPMAPTPVPVHDAGIVAADAVAQAKALAGDADFVTGVGDATDVILEVARERDVDLIVVGTHEPGFVERLFAGSVSLEVARKAVRDVLIVH